MSDKKKQTPQTNMGGGGFLKLPSNIKRPDRKDREEEEKRNAK